MQLRPDQIEDLSLIMRHRKWPLLNDPGTGKTPTVCVAMEWLWKEHGIKSLWPQPSALMKKNKDELLAWSTFQHHDVVLYDGKPAPQGKVFEMTFARFALSWRKLLEEHPEIRAIFFDEWHLGFVSEKSQRFQELKRFMRKTDSFFVPMTGSAITGKLTSAYPLISIVEPRYYTSEANFLEVHAIRDLFSGKITGWTNHGRLQAILNKHCSRRPFSSIFGAQEPVIQVEQVEMSPKQREVYNKFEKDAYLELEDRFLDGSLPGVNFTRCRQIMQHPEEVRLPIAWDEKGKPIEYKTYNLLGKDEATGKDERLIIHLVDHYMAQTPFYVAAVYNREQERVVKIAEKIGLKVGLINGNVPHKKRGEIDEAFRAGELDGIVLSPETAGFGFNWQWINGVELGHVIFTSLDPRPDRFTQCYKRAIREKRQTPLRVTVLEYEKSLDQRMFQIVDNYAKDAHLVDPTMPDLQLRSRRLPSEEGMAPTP